MIIVQSRSEIYKIAVNLFRKYKKDGIDSFTDSELIFFQDNRDADFYDWIDGDLITKNALEEIFFKVDAIKIKTKHTFAYWSVKHALDTLESAIDNIDDLLEKMTEEERDELYKHKMVDDFDLLP